jgi:hypothetical protein
MTDALYILFLHAVVVSSLMHGDQSSQTQYGVDESTHSFLAEVRSDAFTGGDKNFVEPWSTVLEGVYQQFFLLGSER